MTKCISLGVLLCMGMTGCTVAADGNGTAKTVARPAKNFLSPVPQCPATGGEMVRSVAGFCIDRTEVTRDDYARWLGISPSLAGQPAYCGWNTSYAPSCSSGKGQDMTLPVVCIDACDAEAYCKAMGKRLCGDSQHADELAAACRVGVPTRDGERCNGWKSGARDAMAVGAKQACATTDGVVDLIGNVWEWTGMCLGTDGERDRCHIHGGSFMSANNYLTCETAGDLPRSSKVDDVGFRCCADLK